MNFLVPEEQLAAIQEPMRNGELNVNATIPGNPGKSSIGRLNYPEGTFVVPFCTPSSRAKASSRAMSHW